MLTNITDQRIQQILTLPEDGTKQWEKDLERLRSGDVTLNRRTAGENTIKAVQRMLIFLGYSTASSGSFLIDGDFGRGTNRAVAQFQLEHGLNPAIGRDILAYPCSWNNARSRIVGIPDVTLDIATMEKMLEVCIAAIDKQEVSCGDFDEALNQLNLLHRRKLMTCRQILEKYGELAVQATQKLQEDKEVTVLPIWVLSIIRQETAGVVRPRFEQHILSSRVKDDPDLDFSELRYRSMSFGLGQVMGFNYLLIDEGSAKGMFFSPLEKQVYNVARFLSRARSSLRPVFAKSNPKDEDFHAVAKFYNGAGYWKHHYHESLQRWFREFKALGALELGNSSV
ncbi:N-acetylmuramidase domain-containing protein [Flavilitoribacter nigricans]|uniref:Peptidoglycan-binding protein n=1 Tax=Flavilitoribacter nigricans (strain ATCC 23147 / DSM 23189 / NBRC 102662 / NCIMB 1420 / SS-2) TaxID=1122177 RepID=A0A2D0NFM7_FLAN2|nr:N-acetylmuramidase domain-containing protein [Flavilitoribacter nigricans]PHN07218.1 peptidoglycan-binding protein [Flavilitoribacter nigricans DSM 23189 = NBRC 102662]